MATIDRDQIIQALREKVEKDIETMTANEIDEVYFRGRYGSKINENDYYNKYNIIIKEDEIRIPKSKFIRKKPASVVQNDVEYCSVGTNMWANIKREQYKVYQTLDIPEKSYNKFCSKLGAYWKKLDKKQKVELANNSNQILNIYN